MGRELKPGMRIASYTVEDVLGFGGEGTVYLAKSRDGSPLVLKQHAKGIAGASDTPDIERARRLESLIGKRHEHVAEIYEVLEDDGLLYIAMAFIPGKTLEQLIIERGRFGLPEIADVIVHILKGVGWLHGHGIIHRDIKPANIMITEYPDGTLKGVVIDTGVALHTAMPRLTVAEMGPGTPEYAPPEVITASKSIDGRADLYSIGATIFEAIVGEPAFVARRGPELFRLIAAPARPSLRDVDPDLPEDLDCFVQRLMALHPDDRPRDADQAIIEFQEALDVIGIPLAPEGTSITPPPPPPFSPAPAPALPRPPSLPPLRVSPPKPPVVKPRAAVVKCQIEILTGALSGTAIGITRKGVTLGRNTLNPEDSALSRFHFRAVLKRKGIQVRDLNTRNGLIVRGSRLRRAVIAPGEEFTAGRTLLRYV